MNNIKFAGSESNPSRSATSACMGEAQATPDGCEMPCHRPSVALQSCPCGQPHDGWPGEGDDQLCQMCWEKACSDSWWRICGGAA